MRIAYIALSTPHLRSSWSGIPWYSFHEVKRRFPDTHVIDTPRVDAWLHFSAKFEKFGFSIRRHPLVTRYFAWKINRALKRIRPDAIVAVSAAHKLAGIDPRWPMIYAADALYMTVMTYYGKYGTTSARTLAAGDRVQRAFLQRADRILLGSQWAVDSARTFYDLPGERCIVVPMGANLDLDPGFAAPALDTPLTLLFVGFAWERKGGPLVLETWRELRARTGNARLHIVGCNPPEAQGLDGVTVHGPIDKKDPAQYALFLELYRQAHFFMMPSRQEAFGIVYCEAAAFGRPVVAARTGAIDTIVRDGETGLVLPLDAGPASYADRILALWSDPAAYAASCVASRARYESVLNWRSWGDRVEQAIADVLASRERVQA